MRERGILFWLVLLLAGFAPAATAGTLAASIGNVPAIVPVTPPAPATPSTVTPRITVSYTGSDDPPEVTGTSVQVSFNSSDLSFNAASGPWSCVGGTGVVSCSGPSITLNGSSALDLTFTVRSSGATSTTQLVAAPNGTAQGGSLTLQNGQATFEITNRVDFQVVAGSPATVDQGAQVPVTFGVSRTSDPTAPANLWNNLRLNLSVPTHLRYAGASAPGWTCAPAAASPGGTFQCARNGNTPGSGTETITVQVIGASATAGSPPPLTAQLQQDSPEPNQSNNSAAQLVSVTAVDADLRLLAQHPASVANGQPFNVQLTATNLGPAAASNVEVDFTPAAGLQVQPPPGCSQVGSLFRCTVPTLASGASQSFAFGLAHIQPRPPSGTTASQATVRSAAADPNTSNNTVAIDIAIEAVADLSVQLTDQPDPVVPNGEFQVEVLLRNAGPDLASQPGVEVELPAGAALLGFGPGSTLSCTADGSTVFCGASSLAAGQSANATLRLRAPGTNGAVLTTQASASALTTDNQPGNNSASVTTTVSGAPLLTLEKRASASSVTVNQPFSYTLTVANAGSIAANGLVVQDQVPAGQAVLSAQGEGFNCTISGQLVDCRRTTLAVDGSAVIAIEVRAPGSVGSATNTASVISLENSSPASGSATVEFVAAAVVDLALDKRDTVDPVLPGGSFEYQLQVSNRGSGNATGFSVTDSLPPGIVVQGFSGASWTCGGLAAPVLTCTYAGTLAPGASTTLALQVRAPQQAGTLFNRASLAALPGETNLGDNEDSEATQVQTTGGGPVSVDLELQGSFASATASVGQVVPFTLQARNRDGSTGALDVVLCGTVFPLNANAIELQSLAAPGATCTASGNSLNCRIAQLGAGQQLTFNGTVVIGSGAGIGLTVGAFVELGCGRPDPDPTNNRAELRTTVVAAQPPAGADLAVTLADSPDPVEFGSSIAYTAQVRNLGPGTANGVQLNFALGNGFAYRSFTGPGWTCAGNGATASCQLAGTLAAQALGTVTINADASGEPGTRESAVTVSAASTDPVAGNNRATQSSSIGATDDPAVISGVIGTQAAIDPIAGDAAPVVADICANPVPDLVGQCTALISAAVNGDQGALVDGLRALFPEEVIAQSVSLNQAAATQFANVDARLNELRGGSGGFSSAGLALALNGRALPLGLLRGLLEDEETEPEIGGSGDLISRWGGFVNGTLSRGDQDTQRNNRRVVSDFQSYGITAGVDYRRSTRLVVGGAIGYADFDSDLEDGGALSTKGFTLTGYGSWYPRDTWYLDARASYSLMDLDLVRRIQVNSPNFSIDRTARGSTDSSQLSIAGASGYHISRGAWTITPSASVRYVRSEVDGFSESGAGANNATFGSQDIDSVQLALGLQVTRAISLSNGVLIPQFDVSYNRETRNDDLVIEARLAGATEADEVFLVRPDDPDQSYGNVGLGFVYVAPNGRQAYISYRELLGVEGLNRGTLTLGGRFEF